MMGTYEGLLWLYEWTLGVILVPGGGDRHPLYVIIEIFSGHGGGGLKT